MENEDPSDVIFDSPALELSSLQARLAFERTMMSADRSLMAVIQTSLSMIGFGFAMFIFFHEAGGAAGLNLRAPARNFGITLVVMGIALVAIGIVDHQRRFNDLQAIFAGLQRRNLVHQRLQRRSYIAALALLLLLAGLLVIVGIVVRMGPFG